MTPGEIQSLFGIIRCGSYSVGRCPKNETTHRFVIFHDMAEPNLTVDLEVVVGLWQVGILPHVQKMAMSPDTMNLICPGWKFLDDFLAIDFGDNWETLIPFDSILTPSAKCSIHTYWAHDPIKNEKNLLMDNDGFDWKVDPSWIALPTYPMRFTSEQEYLLREVPITFRLLNYHDPR